MSHAHPSHPKIINRLKRTAGHLQKAIAMIEEGRGCAELAQQLHAIEHAITAAKTALIYDHIDHCLEHSLKSRTALAEFKQLTKYL